MSRGRQADDAIRFYESKSWDYDATWHADFTKRFLSYLDIQLGQKVLDLACGTGLLTFLEAERVGREGKVIGIDVTPGMLAMANRKKEQCSDQFANVTFLNADILHLESLEELEDHQFDLITVASALVLLPDPKAAIEHWSKYLKPGGILAVDATHPRNLVSGMVLERVARRLELPIPYNRSWSKSEKTLRQLLEASGLDVQETVTIDNQAGYGRRLHDFDKWDDFFVENVIVKDVARTFASNAIRRKAQALYKEEWQKLAIDGKVEEVDSVFLGIAKKPTDGARYAPQPTTADIAFTGGCRCGRVQFESRAPLLSDITLCHCRACQQLSGSAYLPFVNASASALTFTDASALTTLELSPHAKRTFCASCGTPISMAYGADAKSNLLSLTASSIDLSSLAPEVPPLKVCRHIYLQEKAPWVVLPGDDGTERWGTMEDAHLLTKS
ncbi:hypothetical protein ACN47E_005271 [Coniothyrium glycines]